MERTLPTTPAEFTPRRRVLRHFSGHLSRLVALNLACVAVLVSAWADVTEIVNRVSSANYRDYLDNALYTHTGDNRGLGGPQHDPARNNIFDDFSSLGLSPTLDGFTYSGSMYYNVIGIRPGTSRPNDIYILGAHYDSVSNPGADDNASGVAGILEAARVLTQLSR